MRVASRYWSRADVFGFGGCHGARSFWGPLPWVQTAVRSYVVRMVRFAQGIPLGLESVGLDVSASGSLSDT